MSKIKNRLTPEVVQRLMGKYNAQLIRGCYGITSFDDMNDEFCGCAIGFRLLQHVEDVEETREIIDNAIDHCSTISEAVMKVTGDDPEYLRGLEHGFEGFDTPFVPFMDEYYDAGLEDGKALAVFVEDDEVSVLLRIAEGT